MHERVRSFADGILPFLVAALAFLLGCQEMFDGDVWWHLRAGRWMLEHRVVPEVDTFTYGSASRPWIDLHWLFQIVLELSHEAGGIRGTILLAATMVMTTVAVSLTCRRREWPIWIVASAWLPGILLASCRFEPRPELVTYFCIAAYFGILTHARHQPAWLWLLVPVQILWVNSHGLFILGPYLLGLFLIDRAIMPNDLPGWRPIVAPSVVAMAASLLNPYGAKALLFPLELYPKLTAGGGAYKAYIAEFMSARMRVESFWAPWGHDLYLRLFVFLLVALPLVVLVPSLWRAWTAARLQEAGSARVEVWVAGMVLSLGLALIVAAGIPLPTTPAWQGGLARVAPWALAPVGIVVAAILGRRSRSAAALAVTGIGATAAWIVWLTGHLFASDGSPVPGAIALGLGLPAGVLAIRAGTRPFGPILATTFAFLGLLAIRNMSLFGLVTGAVFAASLGEWAAQLGHGGSLTRLGTAARLAVVGAVGLLAFSVVTGKLFLATEDCHRFGLRERPFFYAHDACQFAGRAGLPDRALVFGFPQAAVYDFHNAPGRRVFIDGRLEVASRAAFETYVRLHLWLTQGDPRWREVVRRMGNPLIVVDHAENAAAEATLLADPQWRCVYHDAVAAVFLARGETAEDLAAERAFPTIDFAAKHFQHSRQTELAAAPGSALAEAQATLPVHSMLAYRPVDSWSVRIPVGLWVMDRARDAITQFPGDSSAWMVLGHSALALVHDGEPIPVGPTEPWDPSVGLPWAQATFAYREALRFDPSNQSAGRSLRAIFEMRGMADGLLALEDQSAGSHAAVTSTRLPPWPGDDSLVSRLEDLLTRGQPAAAVALADEARRRHCVLQWAIADRIACAHLHLGEPASARRAWTEAAGPPSKAVLSARVGDAGLAAWNLEDAEACYRAALSLEPNLIDAWIGLALIGLETGDASKSLLAARAGLQLTKKPAHRWLLDGIMALAEPYAKSGVPEVVPRTGLNGDVKRRPSLR